MREIDLRTAILDFKRKYGTTITFIASQCGVSREHLSRWINNEDYLLSDKLLDHIMKFLLMK